MKNIHILPTEQPSRLVKSIYNDFILLNTNVPNWFETNLKTTKQNIYITSDEEIKEGDWYITILDNEIYKADSDTEIIMSVANKCDNTTYKRTHFKIILTTVQDLINDGVQAIDDEFLEWFVKNPSCEEVEVEIESKFDRVDGHYHDVWEIIIPKEETNGCIGSNGVSDPKLNEVQLNQSKQTPEEVPILAKISHQTDLGVSQWMKIKKLETRQPWLCEVDGTTYVRTEIKWTDDRPNDITWHLNEDQVEDKVYLTHEQLEKLFWESELSKKFKKK